MSKKDQIKEKVKAKAEAVKEKLKGAKPGKCAAFALALLSLASLVGCASANPASRANDNRIGDIEPGVKVVFGEGACSNSVVLTMPVTIGDGVLASADSAGSTETQTATPTLDIRTKIDARYNDALAAASTTSKGVVESLVDTSKEAVLNMMANKATGTVNVTKKDGTTATVECKDGQCAFVDSACSDGSCSPAASCSGGSCTDK